MPDPTPKTHEVIWCRMPIDLLRKIDRRVAKERKAQPHASPQAITRSSVLRSIVHEAFRPGES